MATVAGVQCNICTDGISPGGRLTAFTGLPVTATDFVAVTSIYYTPFISDMICLWDGSKWQWTVFTEQTLNVSATTNGKNYDVYGYLSGGALAIEGLIWTNDILRATAISLQDGRYCKGTDKTRLFLGTFRSTGGSTESSIALRGIVNLYNTVPLRLSCCPAFNSDNAITTYSHPSGNFQEVNGGTGSRVAFVAPISGWLVSAISVWDFTAGSLGVGSFGLAIDSVTDVEGSVGIPASTHVFGAVSAGADLVSEGYHYVAMCASQGGANAASIVADNSRRGGATDPRSTYLEAWIKG
jgi:hypothetical protein